MHNTCSIERHWELIGGAMQSAMLINIVNSSQRKCHCLTCFNFRIYENVHWVRYAPCLGCNWQLASSLFWITYFLFPLLFVALSLLGFYSGSAEQVFFSIHSDSSPSIVTLSFTLFSFTWFLCFVFLFFCLSIPPLITS